MDSRRHGRHAIALLFLSVLLAAGCTRGPDKGAAARAGTAASSGAPAGKKVTFVELGSVNCIPCIMMQEVMRDVEREYGDQVEIVFHDVWTEAGKPFGNQFRIRVIPTQVFLDSQGKEYFRHEGYFPKEELVAVLKQKGVK